MNGGGIMQFMRGIICPNCGTRLCLRAAGTLLVKPRLG